MKMLNGPVVAPTQSLDPSRRSALRRGAGALVAVAVLGVARGALAQDAFPTKPIRMIVPFSTGTGSDAIARIVATAMGPALGQSVIVENRGGAGGIMGTEQGARAPADGYTLTIGTTSSLITNPALNPQVRYSVEKDFAPVAGLGRTYFAVVTANKPDAPKTLPELLARLKAKGGTFGSSGVGTITHLGSEALILRAKVPATHVPYKGSGANLSDVAAGHTLFASDTLAATLPLIRGGLLRVLAVTSAERLPAMPDVPTVAEAAGLPGFLVDSWWGILAPAGTPDSVIKKLSEVALASLAAPDTRGRFASLELEPLNLGPQPFGAFIQKQAPFWTDFVKQANINLNTK